MALSRRSFLKSLLTVPALTVALTKVQSTWTPAMVQAVSAPSPDLCKCGQPMSAHTPMTAEAFQEMYLRPAAQAMSNMIDADVLETYMRRMAAVDYAQAYAEAGRALDRMSFNAGEMFITSGGQGWVIRPQGVHVG